MITKQIDDGVIALDMASEINAADLNGLVETMTFNTMKETYIGILSDSNHDSLAYEDADKRMSRLFNAPNQWAKHKEQIWQWYDGIHSSIVKGRE